MKKAKKYNTRKRRLLEKQKIANRVLREANRREGMSDKGKRAVKNAKSRKANFYKKHGGRNYGQLSMKDLKRKDYDAYEQLLDSIIENRYINKNLYDKMIEDKRAFAKSKGWAETDEEADDIYNLLDSDIIQELISLGVPPSELLSYLNDNDFNEGDFDDFKKMTNDFMKELSFGTTGIFGVEVDISASDFFSYADNWSLDYSNILHKIWEDEEE